MEADVFEVTRRGRAADGRVAALDGLRLVQDLQHALGAGAGVLHDVGELADHADAMPDGHEVEDDLGQITDRQLARMTWRPPTHSTSGMLRP